MSNLSGLLIVGGASLMILVMYRLSRFYFALRGERLVRCPEDKTFAAVRVAAGQVARKAVAGKTQIELERCTHWPAHEGCKQECIAQIENDLEGCRVNSLARQWYRGRSCAFCGQAMQERNWLDHKLALLTPENTTVLWNELRTELLPEVFETHMPVCWSCHMAETFRREHPDKVVDRQDDALRMRLYH